MVYFLLALGLVILLFGGKILVDGASSIALKLGMSTGLIGLTVVAFGTSAPELLVSLTAALKGNSDISIGNVVGSNIANIGLVLGISGLLYPILIRKSHIRFEYALMILVTVLFYVLSVDLTISHVEGILLFAGFIGLNIYLFRNLGKGIQQEEETTEAEIEEVKDYSWLLSILFFIGGIVALY